MEKVGCSDLRNQKKGNSGQEEKQEQKLKRQIGN